MSLLTQFYPGPGGADDETISILGSSGGAVIYLLDPDTSLVSGTVTASAPSQIGLGADAQESFFTGIIYSSVAGNSAQGFPAHRIGAGALFPQNGSYTLNTGRFRKAVGAGVTLASQSGGTYPNTANTWNGTALETITGITFTDFSVNTSSLTINCPALTSITDCLFIQALFTTGTSNTTITAPNLSTISNVSLQYYPGSTGTASFKIQNASLTVDSIGGLLVSLTLYAGSLSNFTLDFSGGSSATVGAVTAVPAYNTALTNVQGRGATVTLNT